MDNRKNTILLTVIAVATLLVAVVGATFAYFTAQGGAAQEAKITVTTGTASSASLGTWTAINIYADATTFAEGMGDRTGTSTGTVSWTAPGQVSGQAAPSESDRTYCYKAYLDVTTNTFKYSATNTSKDAELTFTAQKGSVKVLDTVDITGKTEAVQIPTTANGSEYIHKLVAEAGGTVSDAWTLTVTLENLNVDQNDNTGKSFSGAVKFVTVDCSTGAAK